jgi:pimeloyl-[acyl-carrier protein] synthase
MLRLLQLLIRLRWPLRLLAPFMGRFDPLSPGFRLDPYPSYRALREKTPVYRHPIFRSWILTRHRDVEAVLRDPRFSVNRTRADAARAIDFTRGLRGDFREVILRNLLMLDPPDHTRIRNLVNKAFTPRVVERLRPRIQQIVDARLDELEPAGEIDLIRDFAYPIPVIVIAELLGVPTEDRDRLKHWSDELAGLVDPLSVVGGLERMQEAFVGLGAYLAEIFAARRAAPRDDLISALVAAEAAGDHLSPAELVSVCILILGAGHETTTNLIGNGVLALLRNPGERKRLQEAPELIESAVEELLRYDSPVQVTDRVATQECAIDGQRIRPGQIVGLVLGAANRDPEVFSEPDRLDLAREPNRHLAFGQGVHFCLGAALARAEGRIAIGSLLRRFPDLDGERDPRTWRSGMVLRGLTSLRVGLRGYPG